MLHKTVRKLAVRENTYATRFFERIAVCVRMLQILHAPCKYDHFARGACFFTPLML